MRRLTEGRGSERRTERDAEGGRERETDRERMEGEGDRRNCCSVNSLSPTHHSHTNRNTDLAWRRKVTHTHTHKARQRYANC